MRVIAAAKRAVRHPAGLGVLIGAQLVGIVFGFLWYRSQMMRSFIYFWPFIADSPLAATLFAIALVYAFRSGRFRGKRPPSRLAPYLSASGIMWLIQYGVWCVGTLSFEWLLAGKLTGEGYALLLVHGAMVMEAVALMNWHPSFRFSYRHLAFAATSLYLHDFVDYVYNTYPFLPRFSMLPLVTVGTPILTTGLFILLWRRVAVWQRQYHLNPNERILLRGRRIRR